MNPRDSRITDKRLRLIARQRSRVGRELAREIGLSVSKRLIYESGLVRNDANLSERYLQEFKGNLNHRSTVTRALGLSPAKSVLWFTRDYSQSYWHTQFVLS